jgi:hypothetical protein
VRGAVRLGDDLGRAQAWIDLFAWILYLYTVVASAAVPMERIPVHGPVMQTIAGLGTAKFSILTSSSSNSGHPALDLLILGISIVAVVDIIWFAVRSRNRRA